MELSPPFFYLFSHFQHEFRHLSQSIGKLNALDELFLNGTTYLVYGRVQCAVFIYDGINDELFIVMSPFRTECFAHGPSIRIENDISKVSKQRFTLQ